MFQVWVIFFFPLAKVLEMSKEQTACSLTVYQHMGDTLPCFLSLLQLKGDWIVLETGTAIQDVADENDKMSVICTEGEALEIIRKDGPNPPGKWLVRNTFGDRECMDKSNLINLAGDGSRVVC